MDHLNKIGGQTPSKYQVEKKLHKNIGLDFVDYQTVEGLIDTNKAIVQYESISRLKICNLDKTILILDEAESILTQTESLQANNGCWRECVALTPAR